MVEAPLNRRQFVTALGLGATAGAVAIGSAQREQPLPQLSPVDPFTLSQTPVNLDKSFTDFDEQLQIARLKLGTKAITQDYNETIKSLQVAQTKLVAAIQVSTIKLSPKQEERFKGIIEAYSNHLNEFQVTLDRRTASKSAPVFIQLKENLSKSLAAVIDTKHPLSKDLRLYFAAMNAEHKSGDLNISIERVAKFWANHPESLSGSQRARAIEHIDKSVGYAGSIKALENATIKGPVLRGAYDLYDNLLLAWRKNGSEDAKFRLEQEIKAVDNVLVSSQLEYRQQLSYMGIVVRDDGQVIINKAPSFGENFRRIAKDRWNAVAN